MTITYSGDELFLQLRGDLLNYLCRKLSKDEAADILQEIYLRWRRQDISSIENPRAFLFTVALNLIRDQARRQAHMQTYANTMQHLFQDKPADYDLAQHCDERRQIEYLQQALDQLPENVRHAFLLFRLDGLTFAEIALQMGISSKSVARYIQHASEHCLTALAQYR
ncbi:RNA polymerase sigma factor [Nitrosomonas europaea]|uniref:RNA polymerase sigma factor n=1 Tax=Nitrosomonas europaea TaxID=915 RepID=UPI002BDB604E|nr:RNA polymerase sigma factor [Nitrosomonas europaea]HRN82298.1 RNA polymerase sigma factor [Nitrosomonas europaea]HRQ07898.1 RNA polymerase sigma factor [Nitrosomonas europaea]